MDDTFFGFDTSLPFDGNGSVENAEPSEEEYDALNDETFGSATNGDWEAAHESMVRLTDGIVSSKSSPSKANAYKHQVDKLADSDLELNLSEMRIDDVRLNFGNYESNIESSEVRLDPSVWASSPFKSHYETSSVTELNCRSSIQKENKKTYTKEVAEPEVFQRDFPPAPKFCTLEDIERNIIIEQNMRKQKCNESRYSHEHNKNITVYNGSLKQVFNTPKMHHNQQQPSTQYQPILQKQTHFKGQPIKASGNFVNNLVQLPFGNIKQQNSVGNRFPPGFNIYSPTGSLHLSQQNTHQLSHLNQARLSSNFHQLSHGALPNSHLPIALNNFAMHPNFNAMRAAATVAGLHHAALVQPQQPARINSHPSTPGILPNANSNAMYNMFNMRLVHEIQQNHPLLQSTTRHTQNTQQTTGMNISEGLVQNNRTNNNVCSKTSHQRREGHSNGNLPNEEFDEYANLMSTRDKHWLIGIQLSQLNTDTPYIDDFYYTVYRERSSAKNGNLRHSQAHKDNQLNHPLIQPKGHAQLILVQLGTINGNRDRRSSENNTVGSNNIGLCNNNHDQKLPYVFTPLKFENSLGKLQYGSVTAPRKIIDAEIMGNEPVSNVVEDKGKVTNSIEKTASPLKSNTTIIQSTGIITDSALSAQRKSRHVLLQIEMLYRIVLKLEDLNNPTAIATITLKQTKENERIAALEQLESVNKLKQEQISDSSNHSKMNSVLRKFSYEIEKKELLMAKLTASLSYEGIPAIMHIRKGKTLMRRIMPHLEDHEARWNIWMGIFASLQNVVKKDKHDADGILYTLYPEFKRQIRQADFETVVKISASMNLSEKKCNGIFCSKRSCGAVNSVVMFDTPEDHLEVEFGISSLVCLVLRSEHIYISGVDITYNDSNREKWRNFLNKVAISLNKTIQNQIICAEIESDSIQPLMNHFGRFHDLKLDSLLALITEAKHQIN